MKYLSCWNGKYIFLVVLFAFATFFSNVSAKVGVGMGAGEVRLTDGIKPGGIYELPALRVFNTGDELTTYRMNIAYHQDRPELRPDKIWFIFNPETFTLEAEKSQEVKVTMVIPVKVDPGDYFAFIESGPVADNKPGTAVGVAVATKLFFTMVPANIFQAIGYRVSAFFVSYSPWSWIVLAILALVFVTLIFRRYFSFNIAIRKN